MHIKTLLLRKFILVFLLLTGLRLISAANTDSLRLRFMFYNVENLFDTSDDPLTDDNEFLPGGLRRWTYVRYKAKIEALYKVITAAGEGEAPAVVAMCEVENRHVLEDLIFSTYLSKFPYRIIHEDSPDPRGIDVCLIYRSDMVTLIGYRYIKISRDEGVIRTRSVLYARMAAGDDTLHLFLNHWPSRRGGVLAREDERCLIASMVNKMIDSLSAAGRGGAKILAAGDFNSSPGDSEIEFLTGSSASAPLVNLTARKGLNSDGTYKFQGRWEVIDQIMVSPAMLSKDNGLFTGFSMLKIFNPEFLLVKDPNYPGMMPFSTYRGYRYQGGFSDHLPVIVDIMAP